MMSVSKEWEVLPKADLADRNNWRRLGGDRYAALRVRILIAISNGKESKFGPVISAHNVSPNDEIILKRRREQIIGRTETISEAICFTVTSRLCDQLTAKVSSELSTKVPGFAGKLQSELLSKNEYEITEGVEKSLNTTTSHLIQELEETEHIITLKGKATQREAQLRRRFWPRHWHVYLHSFDYLELSYRTRWIWWEIRETIKQTSSGILGWPLFRLTFYDPQPDVDVCYGSVDNEIENPESVDVYPLQEPMPSSRAPISDSLEYLAQLAFPVTKKEKATAVSRKKRKPKMAAPKKKTAAKKFTVKKKTAAKKKVSWKKTAKKKAVKKKVTVKRATMRKATKKKR